MIHKLSEASTNQIKLLIIKKNRADADLNAYIKAIADDRGLIGEICLDMNKMELSEAKKSEENKK